MPTQDISVRVAASQTISALMFHALQQRRPISFCNAYAYDSGTRFVRMFEKTPTLLNVFTRAPTACKKKKEHKAQEAICPGCGLLSPTTLKTVNTGEYCSLSTPDCIMQMGPEFDVLK